MLIMVKKENSKKKLVYKQKLRTYIHTKIIKNTIHASVIIARVNTQKIRLQYIYLCCPSLDYRVDLATIFE